MNNLRIHFRKEEGSEEILNDFEMRISELFNERIRLGYQVISIEEVENVIQRMGKPEELFDEDTKEEKETTTEQAAQKNYRKRLMRDPDNKIIGGVAGGFAAYMGWDATAIRILLFLLIFFTHGFIVPFYLLCWIVMPLARTATEKLEMRGESVTIENIGKTVTDGFENVSNSTSEYLHSDKPRNAFHKRTLPRSGTAFEQNDVAYSPDFLVVKSFETESRVAAEKILFHFVLRIILCIADGCATLRKRCISPHATPESVVSFSDGRL